MKFARSLCLLLPLALLAGCDKGARNDERSASGEVLQGTISDAMLPLDKIKTPPPLLAPSEQATTPKGAADAASGDAEATDATSGEADEAPATAPDASSAL